MARTKLGTAPCAIEIVVAEQERPVRRARALRRDPERPGVSQMQIAGREGASRPR
jgi:hypothetical protein